MRTKPHIFYANSYWHCTWTKRGTRFNSKAYMRNVAAYRFAAYLNGYRDTPRG